MKDYDTVFDDHEDWGHYWNDNDFDNLMAPMYRIHEKDRIVMTKKLGRKLRDWEVILHKNGDIHDNTVENLEIDKKASQAALLKKNLVLHRGNESMSDSVVEGYLKGGTDTAHEDVEDAMKEFDRIMEMAQTKENLSRHEIMLILYEWDKYRYKYGFPVDPNVFSD
jgi:hypothetical protein